LTKRLTREEGALKAAVARPKKVVRIMDIPEYIPDFHRAVDDGTDDATPTPMKSWIESLLRSTTPLVAVRELAEACPEPLERGKTPLFATSTVPCLPVATTDSMEGAYRQTLVETELSPAFMTKSRISCTNMCHFLERRACSDEVGLTVPVNSAADIC
jgi:hypothetical protein